MQQSRKHKHLIYINRIFSTDERDALKWVNKISEINSREVKNDPILRYYSQGILDKEMLPKVIIINMVIITSLLIITTLSNLMQIYLRYIFIMAVSRSCQNRERRTSTSVCVWIGLCEQADRRSGHVSVFMHK